MIAEKAGGAPLWQQLDTRLFKPLGIKPLPIEATDGPPFPQGHHRHALGPVRVATPVAPGWLWAAGELSMIATELAEWDIARINRTLLPREDWEEMEKPVVLADGTTTSYGLGVYKRLSAGRWVIDHGGESTGFLSQNAIWVNDPVAVVVLTNADFAGVQDSLTRKIGEIVLPRSVQADTGEAPRLDGADRRQARSGAVHRECPVLFHPQNARRLPVQSDPARLGAPLKVEALRAPRLRGGFVNRNYRITYKDTSVVIITYAEPGAQGRWEQFMVMPE